MLYRVCLLSEKKRTATRVLIHDRLFLANLHIPKKSHVPVIFTILHQKFDDVIDNILASFELNCIVSNLIYVIFLFKIPCAKFHASSCSQTKVKVGGHF